MKENPQQLLREPTIIPTNEILTDCLKDTYSIYVEFLEKLKEQSIFLMDYRYYNDGKAWLSKGEYKWMSKRGNQKIKPLFWVSIWDGFFKISFNFSEKSKESLLSLELSNAILQRIQDTKLNGEKMKFLPVVLDVENDALFHDIFMLAQFRKQSI